ncbi:MAG TPA: pilus assembly PilX N-terminal domain-containing protein [Candidatus Paceibacterota bacterium]
MKSQKSKIHMKGVRRGFALLISVIISTIILTIGLSIINTAIKEVILASTIRQSIVSLYAADSGIECALYWDNFRGNPTKQTVFSQTIPPQAQTTLECGGIVKTITPGDVTTVELVDTNKPADTCALLIVYTTGDPDPMVVDASRKGGDPGEGSQNVHIESWGYNNCKLNSQKRVDRALDVKYTKNWHW